MIEKILIDWLEGILEKPVYTEEPEKNKPAEWILIKRTRLSETDKTISATVTIWTFAENDYKAATLEKAVRETLENMVLIDTISSVSIENSFLDNRPSTKEHRYRTEVDFTFYEE